MAASYRHTQNAQGLVWFYALAVSLTLGLLMVTGVGRSPEALPVLVPVLIFALPVLMLSSMTTQVEGGLLHVWFGPGLFHTRVPVSDLRVLGRTEIGPVAGVGLRLLPNGWLYRIRGGPVLVLQRADGRQLMIGTDDPGGLEEALRRG